MERFRRRVPRRARRPGGGSAIDIAGVWLRIAGAALGLLLTAAALVLALLWWSGTARPAVVTVGGHAGPHAGVTPPLVVLTPPPPPSPPAEMTDHDAGAAGSFHVHVADQERDGHSIIVEDATLTGSSGWLVIHADDSGTPGGIIGVSTLLPAGTAQSVTVPLREPLTASSWVIVMLHLEDNADSAFDYPAADQPATVGGGVVEVRIYVKLS